MKLYSKNQCSLCYGSVSNVLVSPQEALSALRLKASFSEVLERFYRKYPDIVFLETQIENIHRRCSLFLKYLQSHGKKRFHLLHIRIYLSIIFRTVHLKQNSRLIEEGAICHFLRFLFQEKQISCSLCTYMYALETDSFISLSSLMILAANPARHTIRYKSHLPGINR